MMRLEKNERRGKRLEGDDFGGDYFSLVFPMFISFVLVDRGAMFSRVARAKEECVLAISSDTS